MVPGSYDLTGGDPELTCGANLSHSLEATQYRQKSPWSKIEQFIGPRLSLCTYAPTKGVWVGRTGRMSTQVMPSAPFLPKSRLSRSHSFCSKKSTPKSFSMFTGGRTVR